MGGGGQERRRVEGNRSDYKYVRKHALPRLPVTSRPAHGLLSPRSLSLQLVAMATEQVTGTGKGGLDKVCSPQPHPRRLARL